MRHYREIIKLAAPIAGIQLSQVALTSTDLLMMGLIDVRALAAGGLAILLYNQIRTMCVGMVTGVSNLVAESVARGEKRTSTSRYDDKTTSEVCDLLRSAMMLAAIVAIVAGIFLVSLSYCLLDFGQERTVVDLAKAIMLTLAPGLLPMLWLNVLRQFAVGMRRAGSLLQVTIVSIGINALLDAVFIYGWMGMPRLGLAGIGLATTLVQTWTFLVYLRTVRRDEKLRLFLTLGGWRANIDTMKRIARMGFPIALTYGSEAGITSMATVFMGTFGPVTLAASNVVNQIAYIAYQVNIGLSHGSSILVSRNAGKGHFAEIGSIAKSTFVISCVAMALLGSLYVLFPWVVLRPFIGGDAEPVLVSTAAGLLWFAVAHQFLKGSQNICIGLLRGLGNTRSGFTCTLIGYWLVGIPSMMLLGNGLGWGGHGIWAGLCIGFGMTGILLWIRFIRDLKDVSRPEGRGAYQTP